jgi:beta-lactamase superfamily II metal-dependent hydrolase
VRVEVLNAGDGHAAGGDTEADWINNDSIVLRVGYGDVEFLLGGDAESPAQSRMLGAGRPLESEVLKIHHHGVDDASEPAYLDAVRPRVGLIPITTDESWYGTLPSSVVLGRLRDRVIDIYASDRAEPLGIAAVPNRGWHVTVTTDGVSYEVSLVRSASIHWPPEGTSTPAGEGRIAP